MRKPDFVAYENSCADLPEHPGSLISAFVIPYLESRIIEHATGKLVKFKLISVKEQAGLNNTWLETRKT